MDSGLHICEGDNSKRCVFCESGFDKMASFIDKFLALGQFDEDSIAKLKEMLKITNKFIQGN